MLSERNIKSCFLLFFIGGGSSPFDPLTFLSPKLTHLNLLLFHADCRGVYNYNLLNYGCSKGKLSLHTVLMLAFKSKEITIWG